MNERNAQHVFLKRLPSVAYQGSAIVHWSLTIEDRQTGWLTPKFYYKFRELLAHTTFRYGFSCPIFCCMPDHIHLMWVGLRESTDQLNAMKFFRTRVNEVLRKIGFELQLQGYDHVLNENERVKEAFEAIFDYIARNPERKGLVPPDGFAKYPFTSCIIPGYPEIIPFTPDFWERLGRVHSHLRKTELFRSTTECDSEPSNLLLGTNKPR